MICKGKGSIDCSGVQWVPFKQEFAVEVTNNGPDCWNGNDLSIKCRDQYFYSDPIGTVCTGEAKEIGASLFQNMYK